MRTARARLGDREWGEDNFAAPGADAAGAVEEEESVAAELGGRLAANFSAGQLRPRRRSERD